MSALEYACGVEAEVVGKPEKRFFEAALADLNANIIGTSDDDTKITKQGNSIKDVYSLYF